MWNIKKSNVKKRNVCVSFHSTLHKNATKEKFMSLILIKHSHDALILKHIYVYLYIYEKN